MIERGVEKRRKFTAARERRHCNGWRPWSQWWSVCLHDEAARPTNPHYHPPKVYNFNVPTFGKGVVYDVDQKVRAGTPAGLVWFGLGGHGGLGLTTAGPLVTD